MQSSTNVTLLFACSAASLLTAGAYTFVSYRQAGASSLRALSAAVFFPLVMIYYVVVALWAPPSNKEDNSDA